jgi:DNA-binding GntR family transcriptional regulator
VPSPTYQRIADDLRRSIVVGVLPPGAKVPSRHELARQYDVSDRVAVEAVRLLVPEGFVEGPQRVRVIRVAAARTAPAHPVLVYAAAGRLPVPPT